MGVQETTMAGQVIFSAALIHRPAVNLNKKKKQKETRKNVDFLLFGM